MVRPPSKGRQKIAMKKIENKTHLGVTFTKRRNGLFKKANELVTLCGAEVGIIMYSPGKKIYSFGHPDVHSVLSRFSDNGKNNTSDNNGHVNKFLSDSQKAKIDALTAQLKELERQVEAEKRIAKELKEYRDADAAQGNNIALLPRDKLTYPQMLELRGMIKELQTRLKFNAQNIAIVNGNVNIQNNNPLIVGQQQGFVPNNYGVIPGSSTYQGPNIGPWNWNY